MQSPTQLSDEEYHQIRQRCQAATPGPWASCSEDEECALGGELFFLRPAENPGEEPRLSFATDADFEFIAHARKDIPLLLAEIARLRAERQQAHEAQVQPVWYE
jgi:hypothetical protein